MTNDIDELTALNLDFVASVQNSDVRRFDEILAPEFYCSNPDKSLVDRAAAREIASPRRYTGRSRSRKRQPHVGQHSRGIRPVIVLTPVLGAAARASCPRWVSLLTTFEPMSPVPLITTTFMTSPFVELFAVRPTSRSCGKCPLWVISGHS